MKYVAHYDSPLGKILLAADDTGLTGLWFEGQKYFGAGLERDHIEKDSEIFTQARRWLDAYFDGRVPGFFPPVNFVGTEFQKRVWRLLLMIPRGTVMTYGALAKAMNMKSARAIGGAIARNKIAIIIPCHRVVGSNGYLTGYAGGLDKKSKLLDIEGANDKYSVKRIRTRKNILH